MTLAPSSVEALAEDIARTAPAPIVVRGGATKRPAEARADGAVVVDTRGVTGIVAYDPRECVVTARAGTPVAEVRRALAAHGQYLPWDPPCVEDGATMGGMAASGLNGPGRLRYGGVRDFILGARVVDGRGRLVASGGQVVKNAAGFLLHHLVIGSAGRFGIVAELSLKVFPAPAATCTLVTEAVSVPDALAAIRRLAGAGLELDALDFEVSAGRLAVRLAGTDETLAARSRRVSDILGLPAARLMGAAERAVWTPLDLGVWAAGRPVVKVPSTPTRVPGLLDALAPIGTCRVSAAGQVVYLAVTGDLPAAGRALAGAAAPGRVVVGHPYGERLGVAGSPVFHDRVRQVLDPDARFR